ncbi:hypothetical protein PSM36_0970 [Proteiniphilum saccharofermentans]|uniref:Uncharacterized protein n=1 Tax=Proteiniphilum saccharofermentans TaxID=1642647 RepID=A0A1R3STY5_9BACT|nr:hypothetical protein [Proteiniphilum saccharofermentans]SCD19796.1 hypothetical protein PSM36_0970 [Proteiniphilum saccharofermentans]
MKKYTPFNFSLLFFIIAFTFMITISPSCSIKKNYRKLDIERLFMQTTKPEITFADQGGIEGLDGSRSVSEEVSFSEYSGDLSQNEVLVNEMDKLDTTKTYRLSGVVVKAKSNFATERDGRVHVDFDIIAPVDILDPYWRLTLAPFLIDGDSITPLDTILVTGEGFRDKQLGDYEAYQDFLSTIVDPSAYDSLFVDWKGMNKDIYKMQRRNYNDYRRNYDLMMDYANWKKMNEMEFLRMEAIARRHKKHMQSRYWRKSDKKAFRQLDKNKGIDTLGIYGQYMDKYKKDYTSYLKRQFSFDWVDSIHPDINIHAHKDSIMRRSHIPRKYRDIHQKGLTLRDLKAKPFTKEDSARIAKRHYLIDEIVLNDMNIERKGEIFKEVVEFPIPGEEMTGLRLDTVITAEYDFRYPYKQPWKIEKSTKKLEVVLAAMVEGIDKSTFVFPLSDTLTYFIASLAQLADESLVTERKMLHKNMVDNQSLYPDYRTKKSHRFRDIRNPEIFDKIVEAYQVYNNEADLVVDSISIRAYTDLEGLWHENYELSLERAKEAADYLKQKGVRNPVPKAAGEDWPTLARQVQSHRSLLYRQAILDSLTSAIYPDMTEENIKRDYPDDYKIIRDEIYPKLVRFDVTLHINRPGIEENTLQETHREDYAEGIKLLRDKEYMLALEKLAKYADYNTALTLVCLGYNDKAQEVLEALPETGRNEYLLAIIKARKDNKNEAAKHLQKACQLSPELYSRTRLDSEVRELADELNLWDTLEN